MEPAAVVVIGGEVPHPGVVEHLPRERFVIAADGGLDHAHALGLTADLVVGDLDSVSPEALAKAEANGVPVEVHRADKDATDAELALEAAVGRGLRHVVVVSGGGDRLDHTLAALLALAHPCLGGCRVEAWWGTAHVDAVQGPDEVALSGTPGSYVTLLPVGGDAGGVTTAGLRFPLRGEMLRAGSSRGVSNELSGRAASVRVGSGALLVIAPHALEGGR